MCSTLFPPSAGDECKNHPLRHGSVFLKYIAVLISPSGFSFIALPVPEVPKMSVGAMCFTSSGSNGGCWVVLVSPPTLFFFFGKKGFFPHTQLTPKNKAYANYAKKIFRQKKTRLMPKKKSELRLAPQSSYAFLPTPWPYGTCPTSDVVVSTLRTSRPWEGLTAKHCQCCGMGGTLRGRSSTCEQRDNCPIPAYQH